MKKKVLVTFVEAGFGHIVTAQAIVDALKEENDEIEVVPVNIFQNNEILKKYENFLIKEVKKASSIPLYSRFQQMSMYILGRKNTLNLVNKIIYRKVFKAYIEELKKYSPDIIIDTHYFSSFCSVSYRDCFNKNCKVITYNPDNNVHGWWNNKVDYFIVNNELAKKQAVKKGFLEKQIKKVFFITRKEVFEATEDKEFYRKKYNIPQDKFCVKIADGAYAKAKLKKYVNELCTSKYPLTIVPICGKNEKLYKYFIKKKNDIPRNITLIPMKFVEHIQEIFLASDLFITKAGPNAVLDSVMLNTPFVINYYANGIEKATNDLFVKKMCCGKTIKNKKRAKEFVESCVVNKNNLSKYIENEKKIDKNKNGAKEIAKFIQSIL